MSGIMNKIALNTHVSILLDDEKASIWEKFNTKLENKTLVKQKEIALLLQAMTSVETYIAVLIQKAPNDNPNYDETEDHYHKLAALEHAQRKIETLNLLSENSLESEHESESAQLDAVKAELETFKAAHPKPPFKRKFALTTVVEPKALSTEALQATNSVLTNDASTTNSTAFSDVLKVVSKSLTTAESTALLMEKRKSKKEPSNKYKRCCVWETPNPIPDMAPVQCGNEFFVNMAGLNKEIITGSSASPASNATNTARCRRRPRMPRTRTTKRDLEPSNLPTNGDGCNAVLRRLRPSLQTPRPSTHPKPHF
jgi:hypothetical protein